MLPPPRRFETDARYYLLRCTRDLWGTLLVSCYWGGKDSRRGNQRHDVVVSATEATLRFTPIARQRERHGYREIQP
jgi:hypothetical protein